MLRENEEGKGQKGAREGATWSLLPPRILPRRLLEEDAAWGQGVPWAQTAENHLVEPMANTWEALSDGQE